jgi:hypothetical protein
MWFFYRTIMYKRANKALHRSSTRLVFDAMILPWQLPDTPHVSLYITFNWTVRDTFTSGPLSKGFVFSDFSAKNTYMMHPQTAFNHALQGSVASFFYVYLETTTVSKETEFQAASYIANLYREHVGRCPHYFCLSSVLAPTSPSLLSAGCRCYTHTVKNLSVFCECHRNFAVLSLE